MGPVNKLIRTKLEVHQICVLILIIDIHKMCNLYIKNRPNFRNLRRTTNNFDSSFDISQEEINTFPIVNSLHKKHKIKTLSNQMLNMCNCFPMLSFFDFLLAKIPYKPEKTYTSILILRSLRLN